jgi:hypothetical protein
MRKTELIQLLTQIKLGFPNFLWNEEVEAFWFRHLENVPFERAQRNLDSHVITSTYEPKIADVVRHDPQQYVDHEQQKLETRAFLDKVDEWREIPPISPERLEEIRRKVEAGEYDEKFKDDPYLGKPLGRGCRIGDS